MRTFENGLGISVIAFGDVLDDRTEFDAFAKHRFLQIVEEAVSARWYLCAPAC